MIYELIIKNIDTKMEKNIRKHLDDNDIKCTYETLFMTWDIMDVMNRIITAKIIKEYESKDLVLQFESLDDLIAIKLEYT